MEDQKCLAEAYLSHTQQKKIHLIQYSMCQSYSGIVLFIDFFSFIAGVVPGMLYKILHHI